MSRKIIALVNRKGGVGKTTSAVYIAMCLYKVGHEVLGVDLDSEASLLKRSEAELLPYPVTSATARSLEKTTNEAASSVVIDTPPNDREAIRAACRVADEVIIPMRATGEDAARIVSTLHVVAEIEAEREQPLASVLLTQVNARQRLTKEVLDVLSEQGVPLLDSTIRSLARYQDFGVPTYLSEYQAVLKELEVI